MYLGKEKTQMKLKKYNLKAVLAAFIIGISCLYSPVFATSGKTNEQSQQIIDDLIKKHQQELENLKQQHIDELNGKDEEEEKKQLEKEQKKRDYYVGAKLTPDFPVMSKNQSASLNIIIENNGGVNLEEGKIKLSGVPADLYPLSEQSLTKDVSALGVGKKTSVSYEVETGKDIKNGTYPVTFEYTAKYGTDVDNYKTYTLSETFYLKVENQPKDKDDNQYEPFIISDVTHVATINDGEMADLSFTVTNPNNETVSPVKITVTPEEGLINKTQNVFVENNFPPMAKKTYIVKLFGKAKAEKKNYSIQMSVESAGQTQTPPVSDNEDSVQKNLPTSTQYTGIFYNASENSDDKELNKPILMIQNYNYGGQEASPNKHFPLTMIFLNTNAQKEIKNIKISLSDDGTFTPVNSSNSFFIEKLGPKQSVSKSVTLSVKPDAETKTYPLNVDYIYQDDKGNEITAKDTISIPVMQKTLLQIGDVQQPRDVMAGEPVAINVQFYNLGKTKISNLKITGSGDFETQGDSTYFVGDFDTGKSDSYSLSANPNDPNKISGVITFEYETLDGEQHTQTKDFNFELAPMQPPPMDDMENMPQEEKKSNAPYFVGGGILAIILIAVIIKKRRNKKKLQELDLDE